MADEETNPPGDEPDLDDQDQDELDDQDGDGDDTPDEDPKAVQEERDKLRRTLERIKGDRTKARQELKALKAAGTSKDGDDPKPDPDARAKRQAGVSALLAEGLTREQAKTAVRLLDLSDVELDDDGDADLEDQVEDLKSKFPSLFAKQGKTTKGGTPAPRTRTAPVTTPASGGGRPAPRTSGGQRDSVTEKLLKQAGYLR